MKKLFPILFILLFIFSCGEKYRTEVVQRHLNGNKLLVVKYSGNDSNEKIVERYMYDENDRLISKEDLNDGTQEIYMYNINNTQVTIMNHNEQLIKICYDDFSNGYKDVCKGCDGEIDSNLIYDDCGICNGNNLEKDECGVCFGNNSTCKDECGVPNGDNSSCTDECGNFFGREIQSVKLWNKCYNIELTDKLDLSNNNLTGEIPLEIGTLVNLEGLSLRNNQLTGEIPSIIGKLIKLETLFLDNNQLSGKIPLEIGNLTSLSTLYLNDNQLTGVIPSEIGKLTGLLGLYLNNNQLTGEIPGEICNLIHKYPDVGNNKLCPPYPSCIYKLYIDSQNTSNCP